MAKSNQRVNMKAPGGVTKHPGNPLLGNATRMKVMAALSVFGGMLIPAGVFNKRPTNPEKACLSCKTRHRHTNGFCSTHCCHTWRFDNPHRGRVNHKHQAKTGLVVINGGVV